MYFAHSENIKKKKHSLKEHSLGTAYKAEQFGITDITRKYLKTGGLLHDTGKYRHDFQKYLNSEENAIRTPHAIWGAALASLMKYNEISIIIYSHHKGLDDIGFWQNDVKVKLKENKDEIEKLKSILLDDL
jgi:CRISPR-associated endonuclease Cas3-HD